MADASPGALEALVETLERDDGPRDEYDYRGRFASLRQLLGAEAVASDPRVAYEELVWSLHAHDHQAESQWGLYFGPMSSFVAADGTTVETPSLTAFSPEVLHYLRDRALRSAHPTMQARYADALWELPRAIAGAKPHADMARIAVDAYISAVEERLYPHDVTAVGKLRRAFDIGRAIKDQQRLERVRDAIIALEDRIADDDSVGLWGFAFDTLVEPPQKVVRLTSGQSQKLVADLEARLARFASREPGAYHPAGAEMAADRLANHYRRSDRRDDVRRVWRTYADIVRRMESTASPLVMLHTTEQLYYKLRASGLVDEADALNELLRKAGERTQDEMKTISASVEIPKAQIDAYFDALLTGDSGEILARIALRFLPERAAIEDQLRDLARRAPLSFLMSRSLMDDSGRTVAHVGPLESDPEGHLTMQLGQNLRVGVPWLREAMERALSQRLVTRDSLLEFLYACPLYVARHQALLERGVEAYVSGDAVVAIHLLVPQIENVLRQLASEIGAPIYTPRRGGGLHARLLDDLLRDDAIRETLGEDAATYFRVLLTDARGWNVRNDVAHGLASAEFLTMPVADRILHCLLVLALLRKEESHDEGAT